MAKKFFRTKTEDRPDLAAIGSISQLDVQGYVFPHLFPLMPVTEQSGKINVANPGLTNSKGQKNRQNGSAVNASTITRKKVDWAAAKYEGRGKLFEDDGAAYESEEAADQAGAEEAQRLAWNNVEDAAFQKVFSTTRVNAATQLADHAIIKTLQKKAKSLRKYGKPVIVMTTNTWMDFVEIPEIRDRLEKLAGAANDTGFIMSDIAKVRAAVSSFMQFANIYLFDSDIVDALGAMDGKIAVVALRPEAEGNVISVIKAKATYGWTPIYIPEGAPSDKPFDMRSWYDNDNKANIYDAEAHLEPIEAHDGAVAMCKLLDDLDDYTEYAVPVVNATVKNPAGGGDAGGREQV